MNLEPGRRERLPAGPGGPDCLKPIRREQKADKAAAIHRVCARLINDEVRPTFVLVRQHADGFSEATLGRPRYRPIVHAAQARFDALASGGWNRDAEPDEFARMEAMIQTGRWTWPAADADDRSPGDTEDRPIGNPGDLQRRIAELERSEARLRAEVVRRDGQLYHAVAVARQQADQIRRQRAVIADLRAEIETLSAEPLPMRERREWEDD